jgi:hypothetical protein
MTGRAVDFPVCSCDSRDGESLKTDAVCKEVCLAIDKAIKDSGRKYERFATAEEFKEKLRPALLDNLESLLPWLQEHEKIETRRGPDGELKLIGLGWKGLDLVM